MTSIRDDHSKEREEAPTMPSLSAAIQKGTLAALQGHSILFTNSETLVVNWLRRRREAIADAHWVLEQLPSCRNIAKLWQVQGEWMDRARQRLVADALAPLSCVVRGAAVIPPG
jgi:hypothetical protein